MVFGLVPCLSYCEWCCNKHMCACIFMIEWFIFLWVDNCNGIAGSNSISDSRSLRSRYIIFHHSWTNLHSHQQCKSVPISPQPHQPLLFLDFLIIAILTGMVVIYICLIINDVEFFKYVCWLYKFLLLRSVCSYPLPLFDGVLSFFLVNLFKSLVKSGYKTFVR